MGAGERWWPVPEAADRIAPLDSGFRLLGRPNVAERSRQPTLAGFEDLPADPPRKASKRPKAAPPAATAATAPGQGDLGGQTVHAVDAHSMIYQVFHAMPDMSGHSGQPLWAVHGFVRDLLDLIEVRAATHLIVAFDHPGKTVRDDLYAEYKADREEMPGDLQLQIPVIHEFLEALGVLTLSLEGFEADDILATIARQVEAAGGRCLLVTTDKDCRQLITDRVQLYNPRKNEILGADRLKELWGIRPDQVVDYQALKGDSTDNVPGIAQIGDKSAQELLTKYGTLEGVLAHAHEVSGAKRRENLMNGREIAL